ncbi:hypothetical protein Clacol_005435 [Clathrus columnatus]|uniref:Crinkler effector protein N-terminal domain-containing protein n=1 Tax=Clathrus columnatus TaxID=1419009 RepID=A0AAV5AEX6_9AGAM|nr:hypothetical protein Clacol_005435 [Clathrus columnatus]
MRDIIHSRRFDRDEIRPYELMLWKVSIAVDDENFQQNVDPHNFEETEDLSPVKRLSSLFPQPPNPEHVHIVVGQPQPVSVIPPTPVVPPAPVQKQINLKVTNNAVVNDEQYDEVKELWKANDVFIIQIPSSHSIAHLKDSIHDKLKPWFDNIPANELLLWKVSIALDDNFQQNIDSHNFEKTEALLPVKRLSGLFPQPPNPEHVHIVVRGPQSVSVVPPAPVQKPVSTNPLKRKHDESAGDAYLLDDTSVLHKLFKALWGQGSDDSIKEIKSEPVPDVYGALDATAATCIIYDLSKVVGSDHSGVYDIPANSLRTLWKINPKLNESLPLVLVDFNGRQSQSDFSVFGGNPILAASSPNRARYKSWLKQFNAITYVMKTWGWNEVFQARTFVSVKHDYTMDELRECFLKYGGCARFLLNQTPAAVENQIAGAVTSCSDVRKLVGKQNAIPENESSALIRVEPYVDPDGSINRNFMHCRVISQHVFNQLMQAHQSIIAESFREISNLFQGQTPSGYVFEMHGHNAVFHLLSQPLIVRSLVSDRVTNFDIKCTELRYFVPEEMGKIVPNIYYIPLSANLPGIDSLISYRESPGEQLRRVFFQFTLSKSHPVNPKFLDNVWKTGDPKWNLIFVVPKQISGQYKKQSWTPASQNTKWDSRVDQYVLGIEPDQFWTADAT